MLVQAAGTLCSSAPFVLPHQARGVVIDGVYDRQQRQVHIALCLSSKQDGPYAHKCHRAANADHLQPLSHIWSGEDE